MYYSFQKKTRLGLSVQSTPTYLLSSTISTREPLSSIQQPRRPYPHDLPALMGLGLRGSGLSQGYLYPVSRFKKSTLRPSVRRAAEDCLALPATLLILSPSSKSETSCPSLLHAPVSNGPGGVLLLPTVHYVKNRNEAGQRVGSSLRV